MLAEAVEDHFGIFPDQFTEKTIEAMQQISLNLQNAYSYTKRLTAIQNHYPGGLF